MPASTMIISATPSSVDASAADLLYLLMQMIQDSQIMRSQCPAYDAVCGQNTGAHRNRLADRLTDTVVFHACCPSLNSFGIHVGSYLCDRREPATNPSANLAYMLINNKN